MNLVDLEIRWQPKQRRLWELYDRGTASIVGFGGSRGGGKTAGARRVMISRRLKYPKTGGYLIRKTLDDLRDEHIRPMFLEWPILREWYNVQEKYLQFPNGSWMRFISSDNYDDVFKLKGKQALDILLDQSEQFSQEQIEFLTTINRDTSGNNVPAKMMLAFNPGDVGHQYHRRLFIDHEYQSHERAEDFAFIRAYGWDNAGWAKDALVADKLTVGDYYSWTDDQRFQYFVTRTDYGRKLNRLPGPQREAQLMGSFDTYVGQFYSEWRRELHVVPYIKPEWPVEGVIDYGQHTCLLLGTRDHDGNIIILDECYTVEMAPMERFNRMADMLIAGGFKNIQIHHDTDMAINLRDITGYDKSPLEIANAVFAQRMGADAPVLTIVSKRSTDQRSYRCMANETVRDYLHWERDDKGEYKVRPRLYMTDRCSHTARDLPSLLIDPESPEGLDFIQGREVMDHSFDALKMLVLALYTPSRPVVETPPKDYEEYMQRLLTEATKQRENYQAI